MAFDDRAKVMMCKGKMAQGRYMLTRQGTPYLLPILLLPVGTVDL
jgi:hypothetical protein